MANVYCLVRQLRGLALQLQFQVITVVGAFLLRRFGWLLK